MAVSSKFHTCFCCLLLFVLLQVDVFAAGTNAAADSSWPVDITYQALGQDPPEVTITADDKLLCPGQSVTFRAIVANGGARPVYRWQINGFDKGTDSPVFVLDPGSGKITSTDAIRCVVTNTDNGQLATSNIVSGIAVLEVPLSKLNLYYDYDKIIPELTVCKGAAVPFYFAYTFGNSYLLDPSFHYTARYQLNGADLPQMAMAQGADLSPYVKNGDVLTVRIDYSSKCFTGSLVSNQTVIHVTPYIAPSITITADSATACIGLPLKFNASVLNAGTAPVYQWLLNGKRVGTNDSTFTSAALATGDQLQCQVTSSNACVVGAASSNTLTVDLLPVIQNSVSITSDITGKYILPGQNVTFTASVPNSTNTTYQWLVNGKSAGTNSRAFTSATLDLGDMVTCQVTKSGRCVVPGVATSNAITILILTPLVVPNTFTPNGDGINDTWDLRALLTYPGCLVQVYNRYGAMVYQSIGYTAGWDGTSNGKPLPVGTYYYLIDLKNGKHILSGSLTILK